MQFYVASERVQTDFERRVELSAYASDATAAAAAGVERQAAVDDI